MQLTRQRSGEGAEHEPPLRKTLIRYFSFNAVLFALIVSVGLGFLNVLEPGVPVEQAVEAASNTEPAVRLVEGTVVNEKARGIGAAFSGKVRSVDVRKGQRVSRGQRLFRMDATQVRRRIRAAAGSEDVPAETASLQALLKQQTRRSPIDGIVTSVRAAPGQWVRAGEPVIRVEDPAGHQVVTLVQDEFMRGLKEGLSVPLEVRGKEMKAKVVRIERGSDKELFHHWLFLQPEKPSLLLGQQSLKVPLPGPGERVTEPGALVQASD